MRASLVFSFVLIAAGIGLYLFWPSPPDQAGEQIVALRQSLREAPVVANPAREQAVAAQRRAVRDSLQILREAERSNRSAIAELRKTDDRNLQPLRRAVDQSDAVTAMIAQAQQRLASAETAVEETEAQTPADPGIPFADAASLEHNLDQLESALASGKFIRSLVSGLLVCVPLLNVGLELTRKRNLDRLAEQKLALENRRLEIELRILAAQLPAESEAPAAET